MPRRIPGEKFVLALRGNDYSKNLTKTDNLKLKVRSFWTLLFFSKPGKFKLSKGKPFGQYIKISSDMLYTRFFAIMFSGKHNGTVGQLVNIKQHVNLCPKRGKLLFNIVGVFNSSYISIIRRTNRALNKSDNFIKHKMRFYNTSNYDFNHNEVTKYKCRNHFKTLKLWNPTFHFLW